MTKELDSRSTFDFDKIRVEREKIDREFTDEVNHYPNIISEMLLATNYVEMLLKDCIVCITGSEHSRRIARDVIAKILLDRNVISGDLYEDVQKIFKIRDQYGHTMRLSKIDETVSPMMLNLNLVKGFQEDFPNWDKLSLEDKLHKIIGLLNFNLKNCFYELVEKEGLLKKENQFDL